MSTNVNAGSTIPATAGVHIPFSPYSLIAFSALFPRNPPLESFCPKERETGMWETEYARQSSFSDRDFAGVRAFRSQLHVMIVDAARPFPQSQIAHREHTKGRVRLCFRQAKHHQEPSALHIMNSTWAKRQPTERFVHSSRQPDDRLLL